MHPAGLSIKHILQRYCYQRSSTNAIPSEIHPHPKFPANALLSSSTLIMYFDSTYFKWFCEHFVSILVLYQIYSLAIPTLLTIAGELVKSQNLSLCNIQSYPSDCSKFILKYFSVHFMFRPLKFKCLPLTNILFNH